MRILFVTFYYEPDLSACSFRAAALIEALRERLGEDDEIDIVTTFPNRYHGFDRSAQETERDGIVSIRRIKIPTHRSGFFDQARAYCTYFLGALGHVRGRKYDLVFATSSRLFTATLGATIARLKRIPLYLDIRDIFVDTMKSVLKGSGLRALTPVFHLVERYTLGRADRVNVVSEGFLPYFQERYRKPFVFFPNGVDREFQNFSPAAETSAERSNVRFLYTGNMGEGQGLEKIVPGIAAGFPNIHFDLVGAGGRRAVLEEASRDLSNVQLFDPVGRDQIIKLYEEADILFLHLNDYPAFTKVLPSKIFEYAASYKPMVAGVAGYAQKFLEENVPDCLIFDPCDVTDFSRRFEAWNRNVDIEGRKIFVKRFSRQRIMSDMAGDILDLVGSAR